jgi:hypothetical protein
MTTAGFSHFMAAHLVDLLQRDHDDISRLLDTIVMPSAPMALVIDALDGLRLAVLVHTIAETRTIRGLAKLEPLPRVVELAAESCVEHSAQQTAVDTLVRENLFAPSWWELAVDLRQRMADHAFWTDRATVLLSECVPLHLQAQLARTYATERMRVLATTAPAQLVSELHAAG